jgi:hypothetical protein
MDAVEQLEGAALQGVILRSEGSRQGVADVCGAARFFACAQNDTLPAMHAAGTSIQKRRLRLLGTGVVITLFLAGCASSPEAARVRGEAGADPGNHGNPVVLLAPPERVDRVYYEVPYDGPAAASEDTSQS